MDDTNADLNDPFSYVPVKTKKRRYVQSSQNLKSPIRKKKNTQKTKTKSSVKKPVCTTVINTPANLNTLPEDPYTPKVKRTVTKDAPKRLNTPKIKRTLTKGTPKISTNEDNTPRIKRTITKDAPMPWILKNTPKAKRALIKDTPKAKTNPDPVKETPKVPSIPATTAKVKSPPKKSENSGYCCFCQMPLKLLMPHVTPDIHAAVCMDMSLNNLPPCQMGTDCDITIPSHFTKFNHTVLAMFRSGQKMLPPSLEDHSPKVQSSSDGKTTETSTATAMIYPKLIEKNRDKIGADEDISSDNSEEEQNENDVNQNNKDNISPIKIIAQGNSEELDIHLAVTDPNIRLVNVNMNVPRKELKPFPMECQVAKIPIDEAKAKFNSIFAKGVESQKAEETNKEVQVKTCPFYKKIPNTDFVVDAFKYGNIPGIKNYFLSHYHYDHFIGLTKYFKHILICSEITARLVEMKIKLNRSKIRALPLNQPVIVNKVQVTLLDANHCPGAVMFLFKFPSGKCVLHCGDFRANPKMEEYPPLWNNQIDSVYLDTTYCNPNYDFPDQSDVISTTLQLVDDHLKLYPKTLIIVGSYTIGKERIFLALAESMKCKIWVSGEKRKILNALKDPNINSKIASEARFAKIHVMPMGKMQNKRDLLQYRELFDRKFNHILAIFPSGWKHQSGKKSADKSIAIKVWNSHISSLDVPYSEHSSYSELERFVKFLNLSSSDKIIPTVNVGNPNTRAEMKKIFKKWVP